MAGSGVLLLATVLASPLPLRWQPRWLQQRGSPAAHGAAAIVQGVVLGVIVALLYVQAMRAGASSAPELWDAAERTDTQLSYGMLTTMGVGVAAEFMLRPSTWGLILLSIDGIVRGIDALFNGRRTPSSPLWVIDMIGGALVRLLRTGWLRWRLGPPRPPELWLPCDQEVDLLDLYCSRLQPFDVDSTLRVGNDFFRVKERVLRQRRGRSVWHYRAVPLVSNESLRGQIWAIDPADCIRPRPRQPSTRGSSA